MVNKICNFLITNRCLSIFVGFILILLINKSAVSQFKDSDYSRDLVVGELSGRVDPVDIWNMIQTRYYPVIGNNTNLEKVIDSSQEQIYKVNYPEGNFVDHPGRVIFKFYDSENSLIAATIIEEIDFAITESYGAAEEVDKSTSSFRVHFRYQNPNHVKLIAYNNQNYILKSAAVRQALTYAIDRSYILEKILGRAAYLADGPLSRESKFHAPVDEYKFNPRKALQLLHQDNWIDSDDDGVLDKNGQPFRISLIYEKGVLLEEQLATRIKIDWNKIGIDVIRKPLVKSEIKEKMKERNYDVILTSHIFDETIESFEGFFGSTSDENFLGYKNRKVDHFISLYKIQKEPTSKKLMFQAIQRQVSEDQAAAFLFYLWVDRYFVNQKKFTNFMSKGQLLPFTDWKLRK